MTSYTYFTILLRVSEQVILLMLCDNYISKKLKKNKNQLHIINSIAPLLSIYPILLRQYNYNEGMVISLYINILKRSCEVTHNIKYITDKRNRSLNILIKTILTILYINVRQNKQMIYTDNLLQANNTHKTINLILTSLKIKNISNRQSKKLAKQ